MKKEWNGRTVFFLAMAMTLICFLPFLIRDKGLFIYFGDYNMQQVPFYLKIHEAVRNGHFFWDMTTDLGSSIYTSYSFYLLGSPFFWITVPFPKQAVPYLLPFLQMIKIALACLGGYYYSRQFVKDTRCACLSGLLYGFSGFTLVSLVFNHFGEVVAFFPFYLLAADRLAQKKNYGLFSLLTALMAITNYFFFFGEVLFLLLYLLIRYGTDTARHMKEKLSLLARFIAELLTGVFLSAFFLLPSLLAVAGNTRLSETIFDRNPLIYSDVRTYLALLKNLILPPDTIQGETLFGTEEGTLASLSLFLPLFAGCGVIAYFIQKKGWDFFKKLCLVCLLLAVIPLGNSLFVAGNATYYTRWFFMPLLLMAVMTASAVESFEPKPFTVGTLFWGGMLLFFLLTNIITKSATVDATGIFLIKNRSSYETELTVGICSFLILVYLVWILKKDTKKKYLTVFLGAAILCCAATFYLHMNTCSSQVTDTGRFIYKNQLDADTSQFLPKEDDFYRFETNTGSNHYILTQEMPSISCFLSTVSGSIMDFYKFAGITRTVSSQIPYDRTALRDLLSVRYFLQDAQTPADPGDSSQELLSAYQSVTKENGYFVYENKNYLHMGTIFSYYMKRSEYETLSETQKDAVLLHAMVIEDKDCENLEDSPEVTLLSAEDFKEMTKDSRPEDDENAQCTALNQTAATTFCYDNTSLTFTYDHAKSGLAFLSIPYSSGFTAYADGKEIPLFVTDGGLMTTILPEGTTKLALVYREPGLVPGIVISLIGIALLAGWVLWHRRFLKKNVGR